MTPSPVRGALMQAGLALLLATALVGLTHCGSSPEKEGAQLEIRVKDHRDAIDDFKELVLTIASLRLSPAANLKSTDPGWLELPTTVKKFDLTQYKGGDSLLLYQGEPPPQQFEAIDLRVGEASGILAKTGHVAAVENHVRPIRLRFATEPGRTVVIVMDLEVLDLSDHPGRAYDLRLRGYELFANGELLEKVPPG